MSSAPAKSASEAAILSIDVPIRRRSGRQRWQELRNPDALERLLGEVALWTAPWTDFAIATQRSARLRGAEWSR